MADEAAVTSAPARAVVPYRAGGHRVLHQLLTQDKDARVLKSNVKEAATDLLWEEQQVREDACHVAEVRN